MRCPGCGADLLPESDICGACGALRPKLAQPFANAAPRFTALSARYALGEMDYAAYEAEFQELLVEDAEGHYWMFEAEESAWYRHAGQQWERRGPPLLEEPEQPASEQPTPPLAAPFTEAEELFVALGGRYEAGELDDEAYEAQLQELYVEDDEGDYWVFSTIDGKWYCHNGEQWVHRDPPLATEPVAESPQTEPAALAAETSLPIELSSSVTTKPPPVERVAPVVPAPAVSSAAPAQEGVFCSACGAQNRPGTRFCASCGSRLAMAAPASEPPPSVTTDLSAATPTRWRSLWVVLLTPIGWLIAWALSGGIGAMLSPWPSPVLAIVISLAVAGAIAGLITGLMLQRTGLPLTRKESFAVAVRFAISWTVGWILGWGVLVLFYGAISGLSARVGFGVDAGVVQTVILSWAGIWGVTGTIAGIAAGAIVTVSLGRLLRRTGQSIEGKRVLTVAVGYPLGWVLGWATGGALGAAIGAAVAGGTGAEAGGAIGGAIAGAICSGVLFRRLR